MKLLYVTLLIGLLSACDRAPVPFQKVSVDASINDTLFQRNSFMLHPLTIKMANGYDGLADSTLYWQRANLQINGRPDRLIRMGNTTRKGDTVLIKLTEEGHEYYEFTIKIWDDKYATSFFYDEDGPAYDWTVNTVEERLSFQQFPVQRGDTVYARFYYKGRFKDKRELFVDGYFKSEWP